MALPSPFPPEGSAIDPATVRLCPHCRTPTVVPYRIAYGNPAHSWEEGFACVQCDRIRIAPMLERAWQGPPATVPIDPTPGKVRIYNCPACRLSFKGTVPVEQAICPQCGAPGRSLRDVT